MRMGWQRHNSVGTQKYLTETYSTGNFQEDYLLDFGDIYHYHENPKQLNNKIK